MPRWRYAVICLFSRKISFILTYKDCGRNVEVDNADTGVIKKIYRPEPCDEHIGLINPLELFTNRLAICRNDIIFALWEFSYRLQDFEMAYFASTAER